MNPTATCIKVLSETRRAFFFFSISRPSEFLQKVFAAGARARARAADR